MKNNTIMKAFIRYIGVAALFLAVLSCHKEPEPSTVPVDSVELGAQGSTIFIGQTLQLHAAVRPENASNKAVAWLSMDETVAAVSQEGFVTTLSIGSATIKAISIDGRKTAEYSLIVTDFGDEDSSMEGDIEPFK